MLDLALNVESVSLVFVHCRLDSRVWVALLHGRLVVTHYGALLRLTRVYEVLVARRLLLLYRAWQRWRSSRREDAEAAAHLALALRLCRVEGRRVLWLHVAVVLHRRHLDLWHPCCVV